MRVLGQSAARDRQFRGLRGAAAASASGTVTTLVAATACIATLSAVFARKLAPSSSPHPWIIPAFAVLLTLLVAAPALMATLRTGRRLRDVARALPPLSPGEPSACRVCGGPVRGMGVVRCPFCASDNVVDAAVLARAGEAQRDEAYDLEEEVRAQSAALSEARGLGLPMLVALALFPVPILANWWAEPIARQIDFPVPKGSALYHLDETGAEPWSPPEAPPHELCVRTLDRGSLCPEPRAGCVPAGTVPVEWLVGKTTTSGRRLVAVHDNAVLGIVVEGEDGVRHVATGTCVQGPESEEWRRQLAAAEERKRRDKEAEERWEQRRREIWPDGGPPAPELVLPPLPTFRVGP